MTQIEELPREVNYTRDAYRTEGKRRERWIAFFGSLDGYWTEWRDAYGNDHLYRQQDSVEDTPILQIIN